MEQENNYERAVNEQNESESDEISGEERDESGDDEIRGDVHDADNGEIVFLDVQPPRGKYMKI